MEMIKTLFDILCIWTGIWLCHSGLWHLDLLILFLIIFCETGLVVTPILPVISFFLPTGGLCVIARSMSYGYSAFLPLPRLQAICLNYCE